MKYYQVYTAKRGIVDYTIPLYKYFINDDKKGIIYICKYNDEIDFGNIPLFDINSVQNYDYDEIDPSLIDENDKQEIIKIIFIKSNEIKNRPKYKG